MTTKDFIPNYKQFPSEFLSDGDIYKIFMNFGLMMGRMICGSKSEYWKTHRDNLIVFNANIIIESREKVWHGDLDVTEDYEKLEKVSEALEETLYILNEMDARFETENESVKELMKKAVVKIKYHKK